jgi:hypothetical protein
MATPGRRQGHNRRTTADDPPFDDAPFDDPLFDDPLFDDPLFDDRPPLGGENINEPLTAPDEDGEDASASASDRCPRGVYTSTGLRSLITPPVCLSDLTIRTTSS